MVIARPWADLWTSLRPCHHCAALPLPAAMPATGRVRADLVDQKETRYIDPSVVDLPYGRLIVDNVLNRTETAMSQAHCFLAAELVLTAQQQVQHVSFEA